MLFWLMARPNFGAIFAFCLGPFGSTAIFAAMTGALVYRFGWFGMGMAGLMGLLVATRLGEGENGAPRIPGMHLNLHRLPVQPDGHRRAQRTPQPEKKSDSLQLVNASSLAMMAVGFVMFLRYQI